MRKKEVIRYFQTQKAVSDALTSKGHLISQPAISKWGDVIPEIPARLLSEITGGDLSFDESFYRNAS